mgnify:FL=1
MELKSDILLQKTISLLKEQNYMVCQQVVNKNFCFDIAARKNNVIFLIKVMLDIDNFQEIQANDLKIFSKILLTRPIIMGERTRTGLIEDDVVYQRFSIPAINLQTLHHILKENLWPLVYAKRGGYYVKLNFEVLKNIREKNQSSLKYIADLVGVSRKSIYEYERGSMDTTLTTASKLEELFDVALAVPIDLINWELGEASYPNEPFKNELQMMVGKILIGLGLNTFPIKTSPFDMLASYDLFKLLTSLEDPSKTEMLEKIQSVKMLSKVIGSNFLVNIILTAYPF